MSYRVTIRYANDSTNWHTRTAKVKVDAKNEDEAEFRAEIKLGLDDDCDDYEVEKIEQI